MTTQPQVLTQPPALPFPARILPILGTVLFILGVTIVTWDVINNTADPPLIAFVLGSMEVTQRMVIQLIGVALAVAGLVINFRLAVKAKSANLVRLWSLVAVLSLWELLGNGAVLPGLKENVDAIGRMSNPLFFAPITTIATSFVAMVSPPRFELFGAMWASFSSLFWGFTLASISAVILGLLMGRYRTFEWTLDPYFNALYATPLVALIPLIILWFGLGDTAKIVIVFLLTFFSVWINTLVGVKNVSGSLVEVGRSFVASEWQINLKIILPATVPYIMAGLRQGIGRALIGIVVAEFYTAITGMGALISQYGNFFQTGRMFVPILVLMLLGVLLTELLKLAERKVAPWKETERAGA